MKTKSLTPQERNDFAAAIGVAFAFKRGYSIQNAYDDYEGYESDATNEAEHFESWMFHRLNAFQIEVRK